MAGRKLKEAILAAQELAIDEVANEEQETWSHLHLKQRVLLSKDSHGIYSVQFSPDARQLAVGFGNGAVQVLNARTGQLFSDVFTGQRTRQAVTSLSYHPEVINLLVTAGADGIISIYNTESKKRLVNIRGGSGGDGGGGEA
uniref:Anaphase-promoting complex subunit 4-like WD40 domain-containing protein n=1 Tax=Callorhinchus milii TaxID=7868 RepID=A0A4W3HED5_CALMI